MTTSPLFKRVPTWEVCVSRDGESILTVGTNILSGADMTPENETVVRQAAHHLLSFLGDSFAASPEPPAEELTISEIEIFALKKLALVSGALGQSLRDRSAVREQRALTQVLADVINRAELARARVKGDG